jgi:hypothetical protein
MRVLFMTYAEFENRMVDTFNRMHYVESCDEGFIVEGAEWDVCLILSKAMRDMFHISFDCYEGYTVRRDELMDIRADDLDDFLLEALDSFNGILDKYNVVPHSREKIYFKGLQII